jgi:hypothetical protein
MNKIDHAFRKIAKGSSLYTNGQSDLTKAVSEKFGVELGDLIEGHTDREDSINGMDGLLADAKMIDRWAREYLASEETN